MAGLIRTSGVLAASAACSAVAVATVTTSYPAEVVRVIDGDTIVARIEIFPGLTQEVSVRERDLDTPEKRKGGTGGAQCEREIELGKRVSALVTERLAAGSRIRIENVGLGKFAGRVVGDIRFELDGVTVDLGDWLIGMGLAVAYDGGTKSKVWCKDQSRAVTG